MNNQLLKITIKNKDNSVSEEEIKSFSSFNEVGLFDILPLHENFISVIKDKLIMHTLNGNIKEIAISRGILKAKENKITIFLGL